MPPRGSNSEVEVGRVKSKEQSTFAENKKGAGARHGEKPAFSGPGQKNSKNPPAPSAR